MKYDLKIFIEKAKNIHKDKYDYSRVEYIDSKTKICIICPKHGEFWQTPANHLKGCGCPKCSFKKVSDLKLKTTNKFIEDAKNIHGDKYDYSKVEYKKSKEKVCITCPIHGDFYQTPQKHLSGQGCPKCSVSEREQNKPMSYSFFIERSNEQHGNFYTYKNISFKNLHEKVEIICPIHGSFKQIAQDHINGHGCPKCNMSRLEEELSLLLKENNIIFEEQKTFDWLKYKSKLRLDFYLPDYNIAIECQGQQHFEAIDIFGGNRYFQVTIERDNKKRELCQKNNITLLYYSHEKINFPYYVYTDKMELLQEIIKN